VGIRASVHLFLELLGRHLAPAQPLGDPLPASFPLYRVRRRKNGEGQAQEALPVKDLGRSQVNLYRFLDYMRTLAYIVIHASQATPFLPDSETHTRSAR
jgi:hypothetical protein